MTDVVDGYVIVLAPKERHRVEALIQSQHVAGCGLSLTFGYHPMLDADVLAGVRVRPTRDVAGSVNVVRAGLEMPIDHHAAVNLKAGLLGEHETGADANTDDHE